MGCLLYPSSHSRGAALGSLASSAPCFGGYHFTKTIINRFPSLTFNYAGVFNFDMLLTLRVVYYIPRGCGRIIVYHILAEKSTGKLKKKRIIIEN